MSGSSKQTALSINPQLVIESESMIVLLLASAVNPETEDALSIGIHCALGSLVGSIAALTFASPKRYSEETVIRRICLKILVPVGISCVTSPAILKWFKIDMDRFYLAAISCMVALFVVPAMHRHYSNIEAAIDNKVDDFIKDKEEAK